MSAKPCRSNRSSDTDYVPACKPWPSPRNCSAYLNFLSNDAFIGQSIYIRGLLCADPRNPPNLISVHVISISQTMR